MAPTPSPASKGWDFFIGFAGWTVVNLLLAILQFTVDPQALSGLFVLTNFASSNPNSASGWAAAMRCLPYVINIPLLIILGLKRRQMAMGALTAFGLSLLLMLLIQIFFAVLCGSIRF